METTPYTLLADLEEAIQSGSREQRTAMLRRVTDLFIDAEPRATPAQVAMFDDVFARLIDEIERKALCELSERMAVVPNAPDRLIRRLAHDDAIEVSGPVLSRSARLGEDDLVAVAHNKSQAHLAAIAGRAMLGESVTDVLVERGDAIVARTVAANDGARFTGTSLCRLVDRAGDDGDLAHALACRRALPPAMFRRLVAQATDEVRERLKGVARPDLIDQVLTDVSRNVEDAAVPKREYAAVSQRVAAMHREGRMAPHDLLHLARTRRVEEMTVALSLLTSVPVEIVDRFLDDPSDDPILLLCKAIELDWTTAFAVLSAKQPADFQFNEGYADDAQRRYRKLSTYSAQRVLRFWQAREKLAKAG